MKTQNKQTRHNPSDWQMATLTNNLEGQGTVQISVQGMLLEEAPDFRPGRLIPETIFWKYRLVIYYLLSEVG